MNYVIRIHTKKISIRWEDKLALLEKKNLLTRFQKQQLSSWCDSVHQKAWFTKKL